MSCVCTPNREQLINSIMSRVAPTTYEDMMERVTTDLLHPQRDRVYELVRRRADQAVAVQRAIDKRTAATVQRMQAFVDCEDAFEDEAHRRNDLFGALRGRVR